MKFGIIGSGSWATALAKILTDNHHHINWWIRNASTIAHISSGITTRIICLRQISIRLAAPQPQRQHIIESSDVLIVAVPSAYVKHALDTLPEQIRQQKNHLRHKRHFARQQRTAKRIPENRFFYQPAQLFTVLGPCHAEEMAAEKLSYLTFSGLDEAHGANHSRLHFPIALFKHRYQPRIVGVQYAAVLKNIYALGAGIAHGLEYGDNFLSVYIANCANEMAVFPEKTGAAARNSLQCEMHQIYVLCVSWRFAGNLLFAVQPQPHVWHHDR